jgi:hypothetical protein
MSYDDWDKHWVVVATGVWLYDGIVPHQIAAVAVPSEFAPSRHDEDGNLDESRPVSTTEDAHVYFFSPPAGAEFNSLREAMAWADQQPWGPVKWEKIISNKKS